MKKIVMLVTAVSCFIINISGVNAAQLLTTREEVKRLNLQEVATISVGSSDGEISSPSDLHEQLSKLADDKGGKYYLIISAGEYGPNFEAIAIVYK
ncbi:DUF1471 domain-containing protein [Salmonella enterica subsp. enterica]|nr:DUF1471 domain-containing protein [Salmonella enterica subsp. enterica]